jgi:hypothetical protein
MAMAANPTTNLRVILASLPDVTAVSAVALIEAPLPGVPFMARTNPVVEPQIW